MSHKLTPRLAAALAVLSLAATSALAQPVTPPATHPARPGQILICPASISVTMKPVAALAGGFIANTQPFPVTLDPLNPPRIGDGTMSCYYRLLNQPAAFVIYQGEGARHCVVRADKKGFDCT